MCSGPCKDRGKTLRETDPKKTEGSAGRCARVCARSHTHPSCCHADTSHTSSDTGRKKFRTPVNERRANNTPPRFIHRAQTSAQKPTVRFWRVPALNSKFPKHKLPTKEPSSIKITEAFRFPRDAHWRVKGHEFTCLHRVPGLSSIRWILLLCT